MGVFRFESLEIWQRGAALSIRMFEISDRLDELRKYRFAEQLRAAALSITNNIAEGSGSASDPDFRNFLNFSRRSVFECANMITLFAKYDYVPAEHASLLLSELDQLSRMITAFRKSLS